MSAYGNGDSSDGRIPASPPHPYQGQVPPGQMGLPLSNDPVQMGLGALMGVPKAPGRYAKMALLEAGIDSLKHNCLGAGTKITEEVSAVKLALDAALGEHERTLVDRMMPEDVRALVEGDAAMMALDAGVHFTVVADLWPHVLGDEWAPRVKRVQAWVKARLQLRLFTRFEGDTSTAGLSALKTWDEDRRSIIDVHTARDAASEPALRDACIDDDNLLHLNLAHVTRRRSPVGGDGGTGPAPGSNSAGAGGAA